MIMVRWNDGNIVVINAGDGMVKGRNVMLSGGNGMSKGPARSERTARFL